MRSCSGCLERGHGFVLLSGIWRRRVRLCTGIHLVFGSSFCSECWRSLVAAAKFRRLCRASARTLRTTIKEENVSCVKNELFNQGSKGSWDAFETDDPFNFSNEIFHPNEGCYDFKNIDSESIMTYAENLPESTGENKMIHYTPEAAVTDFEISIPNENNTYFKCELCYDFFTENHLLENHLKEKHFDSTTQQMKVEVPLSVDQRHDKLIYRCLKCNEEFTLLNVFKDHLQTHFENTSQFLNATNGFQEVYNNEEEPVNMESLTLLPQPNNFNIQPFDKNDSLETPFEATKIKKFSLARCKFCSKSVHQSTLLRHISQFHNGKNVTHKNSLRCPKCGKQFKLASRLDAHMRQHYGLKPFVCQICFKELSNHKTYKLHMNRHSGKKKYVCNVCDKTFAYPTVLKMHKRIHLGIKKYNCKECNISFTQSSHLKNHLKTHSNERSFNCSQCDKSFKTKAILKCHMDRHKGLRNYVCSICGKRFMTSGELNVHAQSHSSSKKFSCSLCNKFFKTCRQLQEHNRRHTGERPFKCNVCSKDFMTSQVLKRHVMIHTGAKPHVCHLCNCTYTQKYMLNKHLESHKQIVDGIRFEA